MSAPAPVFALELLVSRVFFGGIFEAVGLWSLDVFFLLGGFGFSCSLLSSLLRLAVLGYVAGLPTGIACEGSFPFVFATLAVGCVWAGSLSFPFKLPPSFAHTVNASYSDIAVRILQVVPFPVSPLILRLAFNLAS